MDSVLLWGGGSKSRILERMIDENKQFSFGKKLVFDSTLKTLAYETPSKLISKNSDLPRLIDLCSHYVACIGGEYGYARCQISKRLENLGLKPVELISRYAVLDDVESVGSGAQIMAGAVVHKFTRLGDYCIINTNSTVDHECDLGNGVHIMGGASLAGRVNIGDFATIGTNATILPDINIGEGAYVGAGAVVVSDIGDYEVVTGVPAKFKRHTKPVVDLSPFDFAA